VHGLRDALTAPRAWLHGVVYFGLLVGVYGFGFWLPQILASLGTRSNFEIGLVTMIPYSLTCVTMVLWGRHSDATGERTWHIVAAAVLGALALYASGMLAATPAAAFAALSVSAIGLYSGLPAFWAQAGHGLRGAAAAGTIALVNSIGNLGGFLGPAMIGWAKQRTGGYAASLLLVAGFLLLSSTLLAALWLRDRRAAASAPAPA
jgi:ACS family tartrate transporter-like MFS transporter